MISSEDLMRELLQTFRAEAADHLQKLNLAVLALEVRPEESQRRQLVQEAFRSAHSLKGAARTVGLEAIEQIANAMESTLQKVRDTESHLDAKTCDALYNALDNIGFLLEGKTVEVKPLVDSLLNGNAVPKELVKEEKTSITPPMATTNSAVPVPKTPVAVVPPPAQTTTEILSIEDPSGKPTIANAEESIRVSINKLDELMAQVGELLVTRINAEERISEFRVIRQQVADSVKVWREIKSLLAHPSGENNNQISEIVSRYEQQFERTQQGITRFDQLLKQDTLRLGVITSQLQDNARHVRMVPFETVVPNLQRTVRDAAHSENKQVIFQVTGGDVELDKKVLEVLKDPFVHMLRNAVGHGIENASLRKERGKSPDGHVTLTLQQRGSEVRITIADDGGGFDLKALEHAGSINGGHIPNDNESDQSLIELAFLPGVTTTQQVTALSGRGVGLDVVRQRVEELQGHIEVENFPGKGAHIHLLVPSSLTISRGLLVQIGHERYVLPLLSVLKIMPPKDIFSVAGQTMMTVDGTSVPIVALASLLGRPYVPQQDKPPVAVVMAVAEQRLTLLVDDVLNEQELAVKALEFPLRRVYNVAGAALMGDGKPVVVLNAADLMRSAKGSRIQTLLIKDESEAEEVAVSRILVVDDSITTRTLEKSILETAGYEVFTATDGLQALQKLQENSVDLVVSDVEMPNMDGITLTREIRSNNTFADLPVILVTSLESKEDRERGMVAGANAYIVKRGFDQVELLRTIDQLVNAGRA